MGTHKIGEPIIGAPTLTVVPPPKKEEPEKSQPKKPEGAKSGESSDK